MMLVDNEEAAAPVDGGPSDTVVISPPFYDPGTAREILIAHEVGFTAGTSPEAIVFPVEALNQSEALFAELNDLLRTTLASIVVHDNSADPDSRAGQQ